MFDDGAHGDGAAGDGVYGAYIPPAPAGLEVFYYISATDDESATSFDPASAPDETYSYVVDDGSGTATLPAEGALLNTIHVLFEFPPVPDSVRYQLEVIVDDGGEDPFASTPSVDIEMRRPRRIVREGLDFGNDYAWRACGVSADGVPGPWLPTRRFSIRDYPPEIENVVTVNNIDPQRYQTGVTMTVLQRVPGVPHYCIAVDQDGDIVWFLQRYAQDIRMLDNGHLLYITIGGAEEVTLDGLAVWAMDFEDIDLHEAFDMPNGNILIMQNEVREVDRGGHIQDWRAQVIIEVDRDQNVVWSWNPFDYCSTLDLDECRMEAPDPWGHYDWTHSNAVVYDAVENAVYYSVRHLSRIIKIDYATGDITWSMGFDMPSGDADFGDDLFSFQHSPEVLPNGNILLYDNGNRRGHTYCEPEEPFSSAIELAVDPYAPDPVTVVWRYDHPFSGAVGDADRLPNGNTLVTGGANGHIMEVTPDGTVVWELSGVSPLTDMYRAERVLSLYPRYGDVDGDDDIDLHDFAYFQRCFGGADNLAIHHDCLVHDFDEDADVDLDDYKALQAQLTGDGN
jgi:hypothetical protein